MKKNNLIIIDILLVILFIVNMVLIHVKYISVKVNEVTEEVIAANHHIVCRSSERDRIYKIETDKDYVITSFTVTRQNNEPVEHLDVQEEIEIDEEGVETYPDEPSKYFDYFRDETLDDTYECEDNI